MAPASNEPPPTKKLKKGADTIDEAGAPNKGTEVEKQGTSTSDGSGKKSKAEKKHKKDKDKKKDKKAKHEKAEKVDAALATIDRKALQDEKGGMAEAERGEKGTDEKGGEAVKEGSGGGEQAPKVPNETEAADNDGPGGEAAKSAEGAKSAAPSNIEEEGKGEARKDTEDGKAAEETRSTEATEATEAVKEA